MDLAKTIGTNLRILMAIKVVSSTELYQDTKIARSTITSIRSGNFKMIQTKTLETLADYFGVSVAQLVTPFKEEK